MGDDVLVGHTGKWLLFPADEDSVTLTESPEVYSKSIDVGNVAINLAQFSLARMLAMNCPRKPPDDWRGSCLT